MPLLNPESEFAENNTGQRDVLLAISEEFALVQEKNRNKLTSSQYGLVLRERCSDLALGSSRRNGRLRQDWFTENPPSQY